MEKVELNIVALANSESHPGNFALILEDIKRNRRIPITIGPPEARSIAMVLEKMTSKRPQTHDLFENVISELGGQLVEVVINEVVEEKYHALLIIEQNGRRIAVDARTSDAVALAVRCNCPIYSYEDIINETGFTVDQEGLTMEKRGAFINYPLHELEELLARVLAREDYESASRIRDAISRKKAE